MSRSRSTGAVVRIRIRRLARRAAALAVLAVALQAAAQDDATQRALIMRQQQSDEFTQQLRQSQELLKVPPGDLGARTRLESKQLEQRHRLENLDADRRTAFELAAREHFEQGRQADGTYVDEREYLLVTGIRH